MSKQDRERINQRRKEKYELLRKLGYSASEANKLKDFSARKLAKQLDLKVVEFNQKLDEIKKEVALWQEQNLTEKETMKEEN